MKKQISSILSGTKPEIGSFSFLSNKSTYNDLAFKFEGGTPNIAGGIGLEACIRFMEGLGLDHIERYESSLLRYATEKLKSVEGVRILGESKRKSGSISFLMEGIHPFDAGTILDKLGIAIRTGHHCGQPIMDRYNISGTMRASFALYNTKEEIDTFIEALDKVKKIFI